MNINQPVIKGAIILLLTSLLSILTNMPQDGTGWLIFGLTTVGTMAGYFAQSAFFPATSDAGQVNGKDLLKGFLVSIGNALSSIGATEIAGQSLNWKAILISFAGIFVGYLLKQFKSDVPK